MRFHSEPDGMRSGLDIVPNTAITGYFNRRTLRNIITELFHRVGKSFFSFKVVMFISSSDSPSTSSASLIVSKSFRLWLRINISHYSASLLVALGLCRKNITMFRHSSSRLRICEFSAIAPLTAKFKMCAMHGK